MQNAEMDDDPPWIKWQRIVEEEMGIFLYYGRALNSTILRLKCNFGTANQPNESNCGQDQGSP